MSQYGAGAGASNPGLVDTIVREVKSKGLFDKFRKECHADVDTKPAYQNLQQRVVGSVTSFLGRQMWKPDLNKNQLREKMRKHIIDANYLEQGLERIVDQVVNPKVAPVFIPQVEEVFYSYIGVERPKSSTTSHTPFSNNIQINTDNLLPTDLEAVSPDSVRSQESIKNVEMMDTSEPETKLEQMDVDQPKPSNDEDFESPPFEHIEKAKSESQDTISGISDLTSHDSNDSSKIEPKAEIKIEETNASSHLSRVSSLSNLSIDIPLPDEPPKSVTQHDETGQPELKASSEAESSSDSTLLRNVSPLTPVRSFNNDNSCDAQQAFDSENQDNAKKVMETPVPISTFRFTIESKDSSDSNEAKEKEKLACTEKAISYDFKSQVTLNNYSGPTYDDSSNSNNLHIDYQSDHNNEATVDSKPDQDTKSEGQGTLGQDECSKSKDKNSDERRSSHKSSRSSRDSHQHSSSSKDRTSESKHSSSDKKDSHKSDKKSSKDEGKSRHSSVSHREISKERSDKREKDKVAVSSKDRHSTSHKSSSSHRDPKSSKHSSSSSHRQSSSSTKHSEDKKSSSSNRTDEKKDEKDHRSKSSSRDHTRHSSSHRSDRDRKSSSSKDKHDKDKKDEKKDKKVPDDHYSVSGRGNRTRRSTDRDSNDGNSSSSKGSTLLSNSKTSNGAGDNKSSLSKSENNSSSSDSAGQSDAVEQVNGTANETISDKLKPVVQLESTLKTPVVEVPKLPQGDDVPIRKPMIANNMYEARKLMKLRKYLAYEEEKKRQEAALLIEVQEKIHSSVSQVFSGISGPELEFACLSNTAMESAADKEKVNAKSTEKNIDCYTEKCVYEQKNEELVTKNIINKDAKFSGDAKVLVHDDHNEPNIARNEDISKDCTNNTMQNKSIVENDKKKLNNKKNQNNLGVKEKVTIVNDRKKETQRKESVGQSIDLFDIEDYSHLVQRDELFYFGQQEIFNSELEKAKLCQALENISINGKSKLYLLNCDAYIQNLFDQICNESSDEVSCFYTTNYKLQNAKIVNKLNTRDLELSSELNLPAGVNLTQATKADDPSDMERPKVDTEFSFSPNMSSDCSFDLTLDFEKKIDELVQKTSRQEIMEIILGGGSEALNQTPKIEFCNTPVKADNEPDVVNLKRKRGSDGDVVDEIKNNNCKVLMPNKMRKLSLSEQISSTTEGEASSDTGRPAAAAKSVLVGRARRVGLPKPKNSPATIPKSPSSDKSVENYVQNSQVAGQKLNGAVRSKNEAVGARTPRLGKNTKRYDTSDLYKPKLHYLSRRHNPIT